MDESNVELKQLANELKTTGQVVRQMYERLDHHFQLGPDNGATELVWMALADIEVARVKIRRLLRGT